MPGGPAALPEARALRESEKRIEGRARTRGERLRRRVHAGVEPALPPRCSRLVLLLDRGHDRDLPLRLLRHRRRGRLRVARAHHPRPVVRGRRHAEPSPLRLRCPRARGDGPPGARVPARAHARRAVARVGHRRPAPVAAVRGGCERLLGDLGRACPVHRGRDHRMAGRATAVRRADREKLPASERPRQPVLHAARVHPHLRAARDAVPDVDPHPASVAPARQPTAAARIRHPRDAACALDRPSRGEPSARRSRPGPGFD